MSQSAPLQRNDHDNDIDLIELFSALWRNKWTVVVTTLVFATASTGYALYKENVYQSSVLLAPSQTESDGIAGLSGQLGGLASLAGISLGGGDSNQITIAKEVLQSRAFIKEFIHRHNLMKPLMAVKGWDEDSGEWIYDRSVYNPETKEWEVDSDGESQMPSDWELVEAFREDHLSVAEAKDTGMITVSIKHYSPLASQQWAEWLITDINNHMRAADLEEAEGRIEYLEKKLKETNNQDMQQMFYQLIESETRTVMLANAQKEYVFKTVDPAVVPEEEIEPKRIIIIAVSTIIGAIFGVLIVLVRESVRVDKPEEKQTDSNGLIKPVNERDVT